MLSPGSCFLGVVGLQHMNLREAMFADDMAQELSQKDTKGRILSEMDMVCGCMWAITYNLSACSYFPRETNSQKLSTYKSWGG